MSDPVIRRVRRSIDEARNRGGMQAGMPKVTIDAGDADRLCIMAEALTTAQSENEALRAQLKEYEAKGRVLMDMCRDLKVRAAKAERYMFSACAEVLEREAAKIGSKRGIGRNMAKIRISVLAHDIRKLAEESERAGGE